MALTIEEVDLDRLRPHPENPRDIDERRLEDLKSSMRAERDMLNVRPLLALPDGTVFGGNQRLRAAIEMRDAGEDGWQTVPTAFIDLTRDRALEWMIRDNQGYGQSIDTQLAALLAELQTSGRDLVLTGVGSAELDALMKITAFTPETKPVKRVENPVSKLGETYALDDHRVACADATDPDVSADLMQGEYARLLMTSPPYADLRDYKGGLDLGIAHLASFIAAWDEHVDVMAVNLGIVLRDHAIVPYWDAYLQVAKDVGRKLLAWNVWDREMATNIAHNSVMFPTHHEWIFVFGRRGRTGRRVVATKSGAKTSSRASQRERDGSLSQKTLGKIHARKPVGSVLRLGTESRPYGDFPAAFPVDLASTYIAALTEPGDLVIDPFGGSGTTLIAAHAAGRKGLVVEIDPAYVDVIRNRYADFTDQDDLAASLGADADV